MTPRSKSVSDTRTSSIDCEGIIECGCFSQVKDKLITPWFREVTKDIVFHDNDCDPQANNRDCSLEA